jgi:hypothetical protein
MHYALPRGKKLPVKVETKYDIFRPAPGTQHDLIAKLIIAEKLGLIRDPDAPQHKHIYCGSVTAEELEQLQSKKYKWYGRISTAQFVTRVSQLNHRLEWRCLEDGEYVKGPNLTFSIRLVEDIGSYRPIYAELSFLSTDGWTLLRRERAGLLGDTADVRACYERLRRQAEMLIDLESTDVSPDTFTIVTQ